MSISSSSIKTETKEVLFDKNDLFEWHDIRYSVYSEQEKEWKQVLNGISGNAKSGEIVAILGSSGAGKTSLLNILAGRAINGKIEGTVKLNGRKRPVNWPEVIGYVEQEDLLTENQTVQELIQFSAHLRLPASTEKESIDQNVRNITSELGLTGCKNNIIGDVSKRGISGGQRKRVSIGIELAAQPKVLFLDEPTTGLDSFTAQNIIESIKRIAVMERTIVILTIHQPRPDVLLLFDKIFLLTIGKCVFFGDLPEALEHFSSLGYACPDLMNPADHFIDLITIDERTENDMELTMIRVQNFINTWEEIHPITQEEYMTDDVGYKISEERKPNAFFQLKLLLKRETQMILREKFFLIATFVQVALLITLCCIIFFQINLGTESGTRGFFGALFIVPTNLMFSTVQPLSTIFPLRANVIFRERYCKTYHLSLLFLASAIVMLPLRMAAGIFFLLVSYWIIGFRSGCQYFLMFFAITICYMYAVVGIGLMLGSIFRKVMSVQIFGIVILLIFLFFSGGISNISTVSWIFQWLKYCSVVYWFQSGVFDSQILSNPPGQINLAGYETNVPPAWFSLVMILTLGTAFYLIGMIGFSYKYNPKTKIT
jgi:ABC-type multidrug transport system ATPase subunit